MVWLEIAFGPKAETISGRGPALRYHVSCKAAAAANAATTATAATGDGEEIPIGDLDPAGLLDWTSDQLDRAWRSGILRGLPLSFWADLAGDEAAPDEES